MVNLVTLFENEFFEKFVILLIPEWVFEKPNNLL